MFCCKSNDAVLVKEQIPRGGSLISPPNKKLSEEEAHNSFMFGSEEIITKPSSTEETRRGSSSESDEFNSVQEEPNKKTAAETTGTETPSETERETPRYTATAKEAKPFETKRIPSIVSTCSSHISTLYEEPPKVPTDAYVNLPDCPQRGYESSDYQYGPKNEWKKRKPYRIGTLVWYRTQNKKFSWYIPGVICDHVFDKNEVIYYKIDIEASDMSNMDQDDLDLLRNAEPEHVMFRWDGITPTCPVKSIDIAIDIDNDIDIDIDASERTADDRIKELIAEHGEDLGFQGAKQNGIGPHMWGITLQQLRDVTKDPKYDSSMSMYDVVTKIIKPKTAGKGMGYSLLLNQDNPLRAKVMISHAWGEDYDQFLSTLGQGGTEGPFWVCAMSLCQNNDVEDVTIERQLGPSPQFGPFAIVLKQADSMTAIMTESCDIYTRLWCVYEIFTAISLGIPVNLDAFTETKGYGGQTRKYTNVILDSAEKAINTSQASCGHEGDKKMIYKEILKQAGGFELIDDVVMWVRIKALIDDLSCNGASKNNNESGIFVPTGSCTSSNSVARQNAGIAAALKVWQEAKATRVGNKTTMSIPSILMAMPSHLSMPSIKEVASKETQDSRDSGTSSVYSYFSRIGDKLCGGSDHHF